MAIVPRDTPGVEFVRNIPVIHHLAPEGHCQIVYRDVRVPRERLLGGEGTGFALFQARLWPASQRLRQRAAPDRTCAGAIDQAHLLVLRAAGLRDRRGHAAARVDGSAIKLVVAELQNRVLDRAIEIFRTMGLTPDTPPPFLWTGGRAMRFLDGPDEVQLRVMVRQELDLARARLGSTAACSLIG